jgi:hypothetical protein
VSDFAVCLLKKLPEPKCQANVLAQGNKYDANNAETAPPTCTVKNKAFGCNLYSILHKISLKTLTDLLQVTMYDKFQHLNKGMCSTALEIRQYKAVAYIEIKRHRVH